MCNSYYAVDYAVLGMNFHIKYPFTASRLCDVNSAMANRMVAYKIWVSRMESNVEHLQMFFSAVRRLKLMQCARLAVDRQANT